MNNKVDLAALIEKEGPAIVKAMIASAKGGDVSAARMIVDRLMPAQKERCIKLEIPPLESAADVPRAIGAVVARVAAGELAPSDGNTLVGMIGAIRAAFELVDLQARLEAVEAKLPDAAVAPWRPSPSIGGVIQ